MMEKICVNEKCKDPQVLRKVLAHPMNEQSSSDFKQLIYEYWVCDNCGKLYKKEFDIDDAFDWNGSYGSGETK